MTSQLIERAPAVAGLTIRPFSGSDADYAAVVAIGNAVYPEYPDTVEEWRFGDANRPAHIKHLRLIAELAGAPVGTAGYSQQEGMYHPRKFMLSCAVPPAQRGRGIGAALYEATMAALDAHDPLLVRARCREDMAASLRFLGARGFTSDMREWESRLSVPGFDPTPYAGSDERVAASGITIATLAELLARDPDCRQKLYDLDLTLTRDVPHPDEQTDITFEAFERWIFTNPNLLPEGYLVALDGERYVGSSALWLSPADASELYTGLTGVRREYRRRGIALALKLRAIEFARARGVVTLKTWNESNNRAMLSINEALGFVKQPAWVNFSKTLASE